MWTIVRTVVQRGKGGMRGEPPDKERPCQPGRRCRLPARSYENVVKDCRGASSKVCSRAGIDLSVMSDYVTQMHIPALVEHPTNRNPLPLMRQWPARCRSPGHLEERWQVSLELLSFLPGQDDAMHLHRILPQSLLTEIGARCLSFSRLKPHFFSFQFRPSCCRRVAF